MTEILFYVLSGAFGGVLFGLALGFPNNLALAGSPPFLIMGILGGFFFGLIWKNYFISMIGGVVACTAGHFLFSNLLSYIFKAYY